MIDARPDKKSRKFRDIENFDLNESNQYFLLPFRFHRVTTVKEIIVNEVGDYLILPNGTFERIVKRQINKEIDAERKSNGVDHLEKIAEKTIDRDTNLEMKKFDHNSQALMKAADQSFPQKAMVSDQ